MDLLGIFNFLPQLWMYYSCLPEEKPITYQDQAQCVIYDKMFNYVLFIFRAITTNSDLLIMIHLFLYYIYGAFLELY